MNDVVFAVLIFLSGCFAGFMASAFLVADRRADHGFDGGFTASNPPPVRTKIWYGSVDEG